MPRKKRSGRMKYEDAPDLQERMIEIVKLLGMKHIDLSRVACIRSFGSSTTRTIARCHTIGKVMQLGMKVPAHYTIEFLEPFEKMNVVEQDKVIIHELMHIPKTFGGGFRQHDYVCDKNVDLMYDRFVSMKDSFGDAGGKSWKEKVSREDENLNENKELKSFKERLGKSEELKSFKERLSEKISWF